MADEGPIYTWLHLFGVKVCGKFASSRLLRAQWAYYINTSPISPRPIIKLRTPSATPSKSRRTRGSVSTHYRDRRFLNEYGRVPQPFTGSSLISLIRVSRHQIGTCGTFCFFPRRHHHLSKPDPGLRPCLDSRLLANFFTPVGFARGKMRG